MSKVAACLNYGIIAICVLLLSSYLILLFYPMSDMHEVSSSAIIERGKSVRGLFLSKERTGYWRAMRDGNLVWHGNYKAGMKIGEWEYYNDTTGYLIEKEYFSDEGQILKTDNYENGVHIDTQDLVSGKTIIKIP